MKEPTGLCISGYFPSARSIMAAVIQPLGRSGNGVRTHLQVKTCGRREKGANDLCYERVVSYSGVNFPWRKAHRLKAAS